MSPAKDPIRNNEGELQPTPFGDIRPTFSRSERLRSKKSIEELFKSGSSLRLQPLLLKYLPTQEGENRLLIAVPKKSHKHAVSRNLLKRRIREAYRLNKGLLVGHSIDLAIIYQSREILTFDEIQQKLINLMVRLRKKASPSHVEHDSKNFSSK